MPRKPKITHKDPPPAGTVLRMALYTRVSTAKQGETGVSQDEQATALREFCKTRGMIMAGEYRETISGATKALSRPHIAAIVDRLKKGEIHGLVVTRIDRLCRNTVDFLGMFEMFRNNGWLLIIEKDNIDPSTMSGRMMLVLISMFAELERQLISERTIEAIAQMRLDGQYLGGETDLGTKVIIDASGTKVIVSDPEEISFIHYVRSLRAKDVEYKTKNGYRTRKTTYKEICEILTKGGYKNRRGENVWRISTVRGLCSWLSPDEKQAKLRKERELVENQNRVAMHGADGKEKENETDDDEESRKRQVVWESQFGETEDITCPCCARCELYLDNVNSWGLSLIEKSKGALLDNTMVVCVRCMEGAKDSDVKTYAQRKYYRPKIPQFN